MSTDTEEKLDYYAKMAEALELIGTPDKLQIHDVLKAKEVFKEVNDYVQSVPLFAENKEKHEEFKAFFIKELPNIEERIVGCWIGFLSKAVNAPTTIHTIGCIILQIPILHEFIVEYDSQQTENQ